MLGKPKSENSFTKIERFKGNEEKGLSIMIQVNHQGCYHIMLNHLMNLPRNGGY